MSNVLSKAEVSQGKSKTELPKIQSEEELYEFVQDKIKSGEKEIKAYISTEIVERDMDELNQYIDGYYGKVKEYSYRNSLKKGYYSVILQADISDNYYAEQILSGEMKKSEARTSAVKLADTTERIIRKIIKKDMSDYEKELAIHNYIVSNGVYGYIEGEEKEKSYQAYGILVEKKGVCQAYAEAMKLLLNLCGIKNEIIVGVGVENGENHAWNLVKLEEKWYHLDATWDDPAPDQKGRILYTYFNVTDEQMAKDHIWEKAAYEKADGEKYNYYKQEGICFSVQEEAKQYLREVIEREHASVIDFFVEDYSKEKYQEKWASFIWEIGSIESVSYTIYGEGERVAFRFYVEYQEN